MRETLHENSLNNRKIYPLTRCLLIGRPRAYFRAESISDRGRPEPRSQIRRTEEADQIRDQMNQADQISSEEPRIDQEVKMQ
jgi:hypothetical protein